MLFTPVQAEVNTTEPYLEKRLLVTTIITPEEPVIKKVEYTPDSSVTEIGGYNPHNCVLYSQSRGLTLRGYGAARNYPTNSDVPVIGGFIKTRESISGHLAYVSAVDGDTITIQESNYEYSNTQRTLKIDDKRIVGFITN